VTNLELSSLGYALWIIVSVAYEIEPDRFIMCMKLLVVEFEIRKQCDTVNVGLKYMKVTKNGWNKVGREPLMVEKFIQPINSDPILYSASAFLLSIIKRQLYILKAIITTVITIYI